MPPHNTDDVRIRELKELTPPAHLIREFACAETVSELIYNSRQSMHRILHGMEDRLIVIVGPGFSRHQSAGYAAVLWKSASALRASWKL